ncbi:copper resistance system multicopper oxidase [Acidipila sp. 4G-K13]|uniref:Copper resistance system multicopper oxidase n=2 Tax=Paracidobacterium acidisoli TaxID=2303751 RepID=A0A372ISI1_9BACT|nr:copper resistance system multicopper oxidase [Paracidobacterium acidisoli]
MQQKKTERAKTAVVSRRRFVQGMAAIAAMGPGGWTAFAGTAVQKQATLTGTHFELTVDSLPVNFTGRRSRATAVNGTSPGPVLRMREGDTVTIAVTNRLKEATSIHWHGIRLPSDMDGVPGLSFAGIAPGERFVYRFPVLQNGTYWYHSHSRFQEQTGLLGALIIDRKDDRKESESVAYEREYVVLLSDWTDANPETIYRNLKEQSDYYNYHRHTLGDFLSEARKNGLRATLAKRSMWGRMNMSEGDIADVSGATYTYLLNGNAPAANWTGVFRAGERIRLRVINGSSMTFFDVRIPGLAMTVVQADGNDVQPVEVDEFRIGIAEVYDVIVQPKTAEAYTIFAQAEDRTGYARGTLAPVEGMTAAVPEMDPRPVRTMVDMGMDMRGMKMAGMNMNMAGMDGMRKDDMPMQSDAAAAMPMGEMHDAGRHGAMGAMDMPGQRTGSGGAGTVPFPQPGPDTHPVMAMCETGVAPPVVRSEPVPMHTGPQVDNVAMRATERLNDPGDGLSNNGRRVLTYADLRARYSGVDRRPPTQEIELHLSGNMERYIWGFNGRKFADTEPIRMKLGERLRIVLVNDTMMEHPIHLHGLWSELENGNGAFNPYKHTVTVKPAERLSYLVSADTPGRWAYHCHLLYHMEAGMFRVMEVI